MAGYTSIAEAQAKLSQLEAKLEQIEADKIAEPKLRQQAAGLVAKIAEMQEAKEAAKSETAFFAKEAVEEEAPEPVKQLPAKPRTGEEEKKAKMKAVNKKLKQIELLKLKTDLDEDAQAKVASEPKLRKQLAAIENGNEYVDSDKEEEPVPVPSNFKQEGKEWNQEDESEETSMKLPTDPAEVQKRMKNLKKKLQQIAVLKEKGGVLDAEAKQKIASEDRVNQEIAALDAGKDEVVWDDKVTSPEEVKIELEKRVKALNKKLEAIAKLKGGANLDADAQAKVAGEADLKKELGEAQRALGEVNKEERERVAERLGWEPEKEGKKKGKK